MTAPREGLLDVVAFKGINIAGDPEDIGDNELTVCDNFYVGPSGSLFRRPGFTKQTVSPVTVGLDFFKRPFYNSAGAVRPIAKAYNFGTKLWWSPGAGGSSWTSIGLTTQFPYSGHQFRDKYYVAHSQGLASWDGTTLVNAITNAPASVAVISHRGRLWALDPTNSRIMYSDANAPDTWQTTSTLDVGKGDGDFLSALAVINDVLYIFKTHSMWALYNSAPNPPDWILRQVNSSVGCSGPNALEEVNGLVYFIGPYGFYRTNGVTIDNIGAKIFKPDYFFPWSTSRPDSGTGQVLQVVKFQDFLLFNVLTWAPTFPGYSTQAWYVYHFKSDVWTRWSVPSALYSPMSLLGSVHNSGGGSDKLFMSENFGVSGCNVHSIDTAGLTYNDNAAQILSAIRTKHYHCGAPYNIKRLKRFHVQYEEPGASGSQDFKSYFDRDLDAATPQSFGGLGYPSSALPILSDTVGAGGVFSKTRFRKIMFEANMLGNGKASIKSLSLAYTLHRRTHVAKYTGMSDAV